MKNKKLLALMSCTICCCLTTMIVFTMAWFTSRNSIDTHEKIGGSVLQNYFHSGDGSSEDPFTITTPWHYENFVKLHYGMQGFSAEKYYFEFGACIDGEHPTEKKFYATSTSGVVDYESYSTVLDLRGLLLPPLGTEEQPFQGKLNGNNLTVQNFTVAAEGYNDVGIFGYVTCNVYKEDGTPVTGEDIPEGYVKNCYWRDFTIDTTKISPLVHKHAVVASAHEEFSHMGYLAGHIKYAAAFENCYVNDCVIRGGNQAARSIDSYGYFGKVEVDATGGNSGKGNDYSFNLDSNVVYKYLNANYNNISIQPFRSRNTEYSDEIPSEAEEISGSVVNNPLSKAITKSGNSYTLVGDYSKTGWFDNGNVNVDRNYSLSTIGYQPLDDASTRNIYDLYVEDPTTHEKVPIPDDPNLDVSGVEYSTAVQTQNLHKNFISYDKTEKHWKYYRIHNHEDSDYREVTINFHFDKTNALPSGSSPSDVSLCFFLDNEKYSGDNERMTLVNQNVVISGRNISGTLTVKCNLQLGEHMIAAGLRYLTGLSSGFLSSKVEQQIAYCATDVTKNGSTASYKGLLLTIDEKTPMHGILDQNINGVKDFSGNWLIGTFTPITSEESIDPSFGAPSPFKEDTSIKPINLYGLEQGKESDGYQLLGADNMKLEYQEFVYTEFVERQDPETGETVYLEEERIGHKWVGIVDSLKQYKRDESGNLVEPIYISDHFADVLSEAERETKVYHHENIDVVGGGVTFQTYGSGDNSIGVINLRTENNNYHTMKTVEANGKLGKKFYATELCNSCVVLYMKNTANASDNNDDWLGNIRFTYVNLQIGGSNLITLTRPVFKKGYDSNSNNSFINIENLANQVQEEEEGNLSFTTTFPCDISESGAKRCSYCALDKDGNICCTFNTNGKLKSKASKYATEKDALLAIETYVICLGASGTGTCYVTNVDFSYKAAIGYGGVFGSVGYRDSPDTLESTILNFYFDNPENNQYYVKVSYAAVEAGSITDHESIIGVYNIILRSETQLECNFFNYDREHYYLTINGVPYYDINIYTINITASDPATWTT
ncbi:MAG: hypothetical protein MJ217_03290 [Bacilli bacterium]|nr:hypothetical protein [Bacilli bacterium]